MNLKLTKAQERKEQPIFTGVMMYFKNALLYLSTDIRHQFQSL